VCGRTADEHRKQKSTHPNEHVIPEGAHDSRIGAKGRDHHSTGIDSQRRAKALTSFNAINDFEKALLLGKDLKFKMI
jgi:hypothetical protein